MGQPVSYGGQAVLEGVMMRGPDGMAIACRRPNGGIAVHAQTVAGVHTGVAAHVPLLRGVLALWETLSLGMRAVAFSSRVSMETADGNAAEFPQHMFWGSIFAAVAFIAALFFAAPTLLSGLLEPLGANRVAVVLTEGVLRLVVFVGYIALIGQVPGIRRVFQYHGAEHMTVHAHEASAPLTIDGVRAFRKEHTRCGTSFLLLVMVLALVTFTLFDLFVDQGLGVRVVSRLALIVPVAALGYELLRIGGRHSGTRLVRALFLPNIALQALTTKAPDDDQIAVALASFTALLDLSAVPAANRALTGGAAEQPTYA